MGLGLWSWLGSHMSRDGLYHGHDSGGIGQSRAECFHGWQQGSVDKRKLESIPSSGRYHHVSHTVSGNTPLMTLQCPSALFICCFSSTLTFFSFNTSPSFSKSSAGTSYFGNKFSFRAELPRKSASVGFLNVNGNACVVASEGFLRQKNTMFVKSTPALAACVELSAVRGGSSRKTRQFAKTEVMVRYIRLVLG